MIELLYHTSTSEFYKDKSINNAYLSGAEELPLIRFRCFDDFDWMDAVMTTRIGGISSGYLSTLNLGSDHGDSPQNVEKNYRILADNLGFEYNRIIKSNQVHSPDFVYIDDKNCSFDGPLHSAFPDRDGFYTYERGIPLCVGAADCVPVFLVAPDIEYVAVVHSGWKGTTYGISGLCARELINRGGSPDKIVALIGPSICQDNYEVTGDLYEAFDKAGFRAEILDVIFEKTDDVHYNLDLWAACYYTLIDAGVSANNIHFSNVCTYDNHELLFSHRYEKGLRGTLNGIIWKL